MIESPLHEYRQTIEQLTTVDNGPRKISLHTFPGFSRWLQSGKEVDLNPSTIVDGAIWHGGIRRMTRHLGLQTVILNGEKDVYELPAAQHAPNIVGPTYRCEISSAAAAILDWTLDTLADPEDTVFEVAYDGARIMNAAAQIGEGARVITAANRDILRVGGFALHARHTAAVDNHMHSRLVAMPDLEQMDL